MAEPENMDWSDSDTAVMLDSSSMESASSSDCVAFLSDEDGGEESELQGIGNILTGRCCDKLCVRKITVNDILLCRNKFCVMSTVEQRQWLADKIVENSDKVKWQTKFMVAGVVVCEKSFCEVHNISPRRFQRIRAEMSQGQLNCLEHGNMGKKKTTTRSNEAKTWMDRYFNLIGDKLPDKLKIHLPSWDSQKNIYERYKGRWVRFG
jgi:hypothetical protein